ncbi:lecithin:cholesterol acyltransferase domain containing protein [Entamoeba histolytica HM-1:IMSS-B]|uniref:Lecithin:cholesterol acyltransferase domain-containing protein n=4 Tax=Entamoeba histolytica TaxID=5759 RepID=C4LY02_ENTH1|nr:lecithin:cholesterol acyltransferase domain-containing protein [Entamoeba histolytica HM-1:IMSS]EAL50763.1 lecithin:cholesterol acyltransferase domain-containing protein [Entamoeba histolytica HM-1:IMSS]EMH74150.1 lecithin:cholesterol acyltransferase domain containing protein [Entamoeba histolytica HM-1:IMSS-B]ENY62160.1 lecithin:cholesterol acyltransferase domain containing protein [Entamoeba histolytica HM-1:IMSS-A]GAT93664.1 lecithin cholesterol acyltransferase domain-contain [Entamoeba h|eukprot:XP_656149.1 lecithin:cholesterol acyltransferase domain-containing protein [Entamoeba histolytica HM-1:IMSS]
MFFLYLLLSITWGKVVQKSELKKDTCDSRSPVVLIPGLMASIIEAKINVADDFQPWPKSGKCEKNKDWFRAWVNVDIAVPWKSECYINYLSGIWNNQTNKLETIPGIDLRIPEFGSTYACDQLDPVFLIGSFTNSFHKIIEHLKSVGYKDQIDMFGASYDWRTVDLPKTYFEGVKGLIYEGFKNSGKKVVIISHSMGGFVSYKLFDYLGKDFCDKYIQKWIAISAPFIGTGVVPKQMTVGENLGLPIKAEYARDLSRSIESVLALSPNEEKWNDDILVRIKSNGKTYTAKQLREVYKQIPELKDKTDYILDTEMTPLYKKWNWTIPNGVKMDCVYSHGKETPYSIEFDTEDLTKGYTVNYSDGDNLVNINSLESCKIFTDSVTNLGKHGHLLILNSNDIWNYIKPKVCGNYD